MTQKEINKLTTKQAIKLLEQIAKGHRIIFTGGYGAEEAWDEDTTLSVGSAWLDATRGNELMGGGKFIPAIFIKTNIVTG